MKKITYKLILGLSMLIMIGVAAPACTGSSCGTTKAEKKKKMKSLKKNTNFKM